MGHREFDVKIAVSFALVVLLVVGILAILPRTVSATSFPVVEIANGGNVSSGTVHPLNMPKSGGLQATDLIIVSWCVGNLEPFSDTNLSSQGFSSLVDTGGSGGKTGRQVVWYKVGTSIPDVINVTSVSTAFASVHESFRIAGARTTEAPANFLDVAATYGFTLSPDPPSLNPSGWGTENTLWLTMACNFQGPDGTPFFNSGPTSYVDIREDESLSSNGKIIRSAYRHNLVDVENPGVFDMTGNDPFGRCGSEPNFCWSAVTIAVRPQATAPLVTLPATSVGTTFAKLNGRLDVLFSSSVNLTFQWGATPSLGNSTTSIFRSSTGAYSIVIHDLEPNATYYFRAHSIEVPSGYESFGSTLNFTTLDDTLPEILVIGWNVFVVLMFVALLVVMVIGAYLFAKWGEGGHGGV